MALVSIALEITPGRAWREALRSRRSRRSWICALIVVHVRGARVVRVVLNLLDVAHEIGARIDELQGTDTAVNRECGVLKPVLAVRGVVQLHAEVGLRLTERIRRHLGEDAVRLDTLVGLCE